jgi:pimeloyl-ACP methyl ester carboxylesterase
MFLASPLNRFSCAIERATLQINKDKIMLCKKNITAWLAIIMAIVAAASSGNAVHAAPPTKDCAIPDGPRAAAMAEGKRFTVQIEGDGPDIILIPGLASSRAVWEATVASLAGCYRVHSVQVRGFGDQPLAAAYTDDVGEAVDASADADEAVAVEAGEAVNAREPVDASINASGPMLDPFVRELADYIDDEILNKDLPAPAIIGHSLGGLSALMIGARYPKAAGKIMVVDALPFIGTLFNPAATVESERPRAEAMASATRADYSGVPKPEVNADPGANSQAGFWSNSEKGRILVANMSAASDQRVVAQALYDDMQTDMRPQLPKISAPVTLLYAQDDSVMPPAMAKAVFEGQYAGTANFTPVMISGSRHFIMLDQPEKFHLALRGFLANIAK